ncbi:MAG: hypothetical protein KDA24_28055, partial [Deltaproteobacteria bacterium]|nr:hypothetical protein [Deltaproteobacteria bacterium]
MRRVGLVLLGALAVAVLADVLLGIFSVPAAAVEHALVQVVLWPFVLADTTAMLPHKPLDVLIQGFGTGVFGWFLARWADEGRRYVGGVLDLTIAAPLLLVCVAVFGAGLALAPPVVIGCLTAAVFGAFATRTGRHVERELPASGLPRGGARWLMLLGAGLALMMTGTVMASGPGDSQVPFALLASLEGAVAPVLWPWLVSAVALAVLFGLWPRGTVETQRAGQWGRVLMAVLLGTSVTSTFVGWTAPGGE